MNVTKQLENAGFNFYHNPQKKDLMGYAGSYKLKVYSPDYKTTSDILYHIDVTTVDYNNTPYRQQCPKHLLQDLSIESTVRFISKEGVHFEMSYFENNVEDMVKFFENAYTLLGCEPVDYD